MNISTPTTRTLLIPLIAAGLLAGGRPAPAMSSTVAGKACCQQPASDSTCCGQSCCQVPTPQPKQNAPDQSKRSNDRTGDGMFLSVGAVEFYRDPDQATCPGHFSCLGGSGGPSLIAQHVRLQI